MGARRLGRFLRSIAGGMALVAVTPAYAVPASAQELCMGERATIVGTSGDDHLAGTPGRDVIVALQGNDTVEAHDGDDLICAGGGHDRVYARGGDDRVHGAVGRDRIRGGDGDDDLDGGWEADLLVGGKGGDRLSGGRHDVHYIDRAVYVGSASPISADLAAGRVTGAAIGTDEVRYMEGVVGTSGADELLGDGRPNDFAGRGGDDTIDGRGGADTIFGGLRRPPPWWEGADGLDVVHGGGGDDHISGGYDSDELFGGGGADVLMSLGDWWHHHEPWEEALTVIRDGAGTLHGGQGDDELASGPGDDTLDGNDGLDLVSYAGVDGGVAVDLRADSARGEGVDALISIEGAVGTGYRDSLLGDNGANVFEGYGGGDTVRGFGGDDRLSASGETQALPLMLYGGGGDDELVLHGVCLGPPARGCPPEAVGSGTLTGGPGDDVLRSFPQGFTLDGGEGADTAAYSTDYYGMVIDLVRGEAWLNHERSCCGHDTLVSIENAEGGREDDILLGNDAPNVLVGLQNQDLIEGGAGDDTIDGGEGVDSADGGEGDDSCANVETAVSC